MLHAQLLVHRVLLSEMGLKCLPSLPPSPLLIPTSFPSPFLPPIHYSLHCFLSLTHEEFKKSYENDSQNSDNINFLRVGWSNKQLTTLKPLLSEIEYLQDQHLLLTVKSVDGYESYGKERLLFTADKEKEFLIV